MPTRSTPGARTRRKRYNSPSEPTSENDLMTCLRLAAAALTLLALPALAQPALQASPNNRIGFVNTERVLRDSAPAIRAQTTLKAEFPKREAATARLEEQRKRPRATPTKHRRPTTGGHA